MRPALFLHSWIVPKLIIGAMFGKRVSKNHFLPLPMEKARFFRLARKSSLGYSIAPTIRRLAVPGVRIEKTFKKRLIKKTPAMQGSILECISKLCDDPHHPGLHTSKVRGADGVFEAYIDQANRLTFNWDNGVIVLRNHCNHQITSRSP